jgi:hypothetical protein
VIETLFVTNEDNIINRSYCWDSIIEDSRSLISKAAYSSYKGYGYSQVSKYLTKSRNKTGRRELFEKHGIDTKFISHFFRLMQEARELLLTNRIKFPYENSNYLKQIKNGQIYNNSNIEQLEKDIKNELDKLDETVKISTLPSHGDRELLNKLLISIYDNYV